MTATRVRGLLSAGPVQYADLQGVSIGAAHNTESLVAINQYSGAVFLCPQDFTLARIYKDVFSRTETGGLYEVRAETVDLANGRPTGTLVASGAKVTLPAGTGGAFVALDTPVALTRGTYYYVGNKCVTAPSSGGVVYNATPNDGLLRVARAQPYRVGPAVSSLSFDPSFTAMEDNAGNKVVVPGLLCYAASAYENWGSTSNPNRRGARFRVPVPLTLYGVEMWQSQLENMALLLYDVDGSTVLMSQTVDVDVAAGINEMWRWYPLPPTVLTPDSYYRLVILPSTTSTRNWWVTMTAASAECWDAFMPLGQDCHWTTCDGAPANEAAWTNTTTKRPWGLAFYFSHADDGAGAGGAGGPLGVRFMPSMRRGRR